MIRAILWKEYREHRAIWLTLAMVGWAGMYGLLRLMAPESGATERVGPIEPVESVAVLFAWAYGLVCGSMLLAGEREGATMTFLDMMPLRRLQLWLVKSVFGLVLVLGQVIVLFVCLIGLGIPENLWQGGGILLVMLLSGVVGMAWGLLFSSRCENVLNAIGMAVGAQLISYLVVGLLVKLIAMVLKNTVREDPIAIVCLLFLGCLVAVVLTVGPIIGSARIFSRPDRLRGSSARLEWSSTDMPKGASWIALLWLTYTQMRRLIIGLIVFALALGCLMPPAGPVAWPIFTLFIGVLCGVTVCADEQANGSFRFLGDQRLPLGRVWIVKLGMRFMLTVFAAFLFMLPSLILTIVHQLTSNSPPERQVPFFSEVLHSILVGPVVPVGVHLTIWLLYGFSVGQLSALLFRKSVVAAVVAFGVSALLVSLWVPSLLGIGLHFWQIAGVPLVLLLMGWALVPAWTANRLMARRTFVGLGVIFLTVALLIAGGLWYRVAEVPDVPDQFDMAAFVAGIPSPEENKAGQIIRSVCTKIAERERSLRPAQTISQPDTLRLQAEEIHNRGWPKDKPELAEWLDAMVPDNWLADLAEVPDLPLGVVEDPRQHTISSRLPNVQASRLLLIVLAARGLQRQATGDNEVFVDNLRIGLAILRNLRHDATFVVSSAGKGMERALLSALDRWLEKLRGHPELLKRVLRILQRHEAELPDERESLQAGYLIARNTLEEAPEQVLNNYTRLHAFQGVERQRAEFQGAALAWLFPWERERHLRILRVLFQGDERQRRQVREWGGIIFEELVSYLNRLSRPERNLARLHASQLEVALRLYQTETGKPAATLDVLVPRYLPAIPVDPFDGQPFRYRLSKGERIGWPPSFLPGGSGMPPAPPPSPTRLVPEGQGILWSVGEDGLDDGGVRQSIKSTSTQSGEDLLYLVPPPAK